MIDHLPSLYGTTYLDVLPAGATTSAAPVEASPRREYVAVENLGARGGELPDGEARPGPCGWHSLREYEEMFLSPAVGASFNALRAAVLAGGINFLPAVKPPVGPTQPGQDDATVEAEMAAMIADSNRRTVEDWDTPLNLVLWEAMEAMAFGHMLGEPVYRDVAGGADEGLLAIRTFKWKPRSSYRFRVDHAMNVVAIRALALNEAGDALGWRELAPDDVAWLTWDPYRGDPRGRSMFRMARHAWKMLCELWPEVMKGWKQFGTPFLWGTTAQNARMAPAVDRNGKPIPGAEQIPAEVAMAAAMVRLVNGAVAAGPYGSDVKPVESAKDSTVVSGAIGILQGEITRALLLQTRATIESKHGSRADSETGQDIMGTLVRFLRIWLERWTRRLLMRQNALNYGEDIARRLTPLVDLGSTEHQDFASNAAGVGVLYQASFFTPSQLPAVDLLLGLPQRIAGEPRVGPQGVVPDAAPTEDPNAAPPPAEQAPGTAPAEGEVAT